MQVLGALTAINTELGKAFAALVWQDAPPQWQTSLITARFPSLHVATPAQAQQRHSAPAASSYNLATAMHAAFATHGLPATRQPASTGGLDSLRCLAGVLELLSAVTSLPGLGDHITEDSWEAVVAAVTNTATAVCGCTGKQQKTLLEWVTSHRAEAVHRAEKQHQQRQEAVMLSMLTAWKVCGSLLGHHTSCSG